MLLLYLLLIHGPRLASRCEVTAGLFASRSSAEKSLLEHCLRREEEAGDSQPLELILETGDPRFAIEAYFSEHEDEDFEIVELEVSI